MTRAVLMGDIAWPHLYHVGDEAMTESALEQLRSRGVEHITLVGADPEVAERLHGTPAVPRFHFKLRWPRAWQDSHLRKVLQPLADYTRGPGPAATVLDAVFDSDVVVIAGGGNMTSAFVHQLYERLALVRVARHFGRPIYISSQTIGTVWRDADVSVINEILEGARMFGARERSSLEEAKTLVPSHRGIVYTGDDALLAKATEPSPGLREILPERYLVASFERPTWIEETAVEQYFAEVACALDASAAALDCSVLLIPHAGSFDEATPKDDVLSHARIAALSTRIIDLPLLRTGEVLAVMRDALLSVSTRYHPLIFAASLGVPMIGLAHTAYTWHRMVGAARQYGIEGSVLPSGALRDPVSFANVVAELSASTAVRASIEENRAKRAANLHDWWDALVADASSAARGGLAEALTHFAELAEPEQVPPPTAMIPLLPDVRKEAISRGEAEERLRWSREAWSTQEAALQGLAADLRRQVELLEAELLALRADVDERDAQLEGKTLQLERANEALREAVAEKTEWRTAAKAFRAEVQRFRNRRTTRMLDALGRLRRRR
jgi:colanic acid/amylovoran biosynthesis protein